MHCLKCWHVINIWLYDPFSLQPNLHFSEFESFHLYKFSWLGSILCNNLKWKSSIFLFFWDFMRDVHISLQVYLLVNILSQYFSMKDRSLLFDIINLYIFSFHWQVINVFVFSKNERF